MNGNLYGSHGNRDRTTVELKGISPDQSLGLVEIRVLRSIRAKPAKVHPCREPLAHLVGFYATPAGNDGA